ncbi:hypothetical protein Bbelb_052130 [Branchiostoma belcheri]|nr:hypothetical protein Bbelb_052130 [Branchiostoma belcheri]
MLFLDFAKAFDSVSHTLLLHKLQMFGFGGNLLAWFTSYLTDRRQRVVVEGCQSKWLPVTSGVPQGSILGPFLFLLFINDLPCAATQSTVALFADDSKCFREVSKLNDCVKLQNDITAMYNWSLTWKMSFHPSKCKLIRLTRSKSPIVYSYHMSDTTITSVDSMPDLGVIVQSDLQWNSHILKMVARANSMTGFIKRTVGFNSSTDVRKALYTTLVRSILEYCSPLWSPQSRKLMSLVEGVQRRATKFILGAHSNTLTYKERLSTLGLLPLAHRREVCDVMVFIKSKPIVHKYVSFPSRPSRYLRSHMLTPIRVRTSAFSSSYIPRLVTIWNQLSPVLRNIGVQASEMSNILTFKRSLVRATFMRFDTQFNIDVPCSWSTSCGCASCTALRPH